MSLYKRNPSKYWRYHEKYKKHCQNHRYQNSFWAPEMYKKLCSSEPWRFVVRLAQCNISWMKTLWIGTNHLHAIAIRSKGNKCPKWPTSISHGLSCDYSSPNQFTTLLRNRKEVITKNVRNNSRVIVFTFYHIQLTK